MLHYFYNKLPNFSNQRLYGELLKSFRNSFLESL
jgi:hypothetical protein